MWKDELALIPGVVALIAPLAGTARYGRHLAIRPKPQLDRSIGPVLRRTEDIAAWVAVASRHERRRRSWVQCQGSWPSQGSWPRFVAKVRGRDCRNFHRHLCRIAAQRGWYPHDGGDCQGLVAPEADLHLLRELESAPSAGCGAMSTRLRRCGRSMSRSWSTPPSAPA